MCVEKRELFSFYLLWVLLLFPENCARTCCHKRPQASSEHARQDRRESERVPPKSARLLLGQV